MTQAEYEAIKARAKRGSTPWYAAMNGDRAALIELVECLLAMTPAHRFGLEPPPAAPGAER